MSKVKDNRLKSCIFCLFNDHVMWVKNWGGYIFAKEFEKEVGLKNKITTIWFASLIDLVSLEDGRLEQYLRQIDEQNLPHLKRYVAQARFLYAQVAELLSSFSIEEQVFIHDFRDDLVHGFLTGKHARERNIKYVENLKLVTRRVPREEREKLIWDALEQKGHKPLDDFLSDIRQRFLRPSKYQLILRELCSCHKAVYEAINNNKEFEFESIPV